MQDASIHSRDHIRWKFPHLLLMLIPGVIFLATYPGYYREELERAEKELLVQPWLNYPPEYCAFLAGLHSGAYMVMAMLLCAAILALNQPTRRRTLIRFLFAFGIMTMVNLVLCSGGCALGSRQTTELQDTVRKLYHPIVPQGTDSDPDAGQSP
jgi:hypothetical protein